MCVCVIGCLHPMKKIGDYHYSLVASLLLNLYSFVFFSKELNDFGFTLAL